MMQHVIHIVGYIVTWAAVQYKRNEGSRIELISKDWFIILVLIAVAQIFLDV